MRRKEYAASLGLANTGRGRMSREALDAIEKARANGMIFDDDAPTVSKAPKSEKVKASKPARESAGVVGETTLRYPLDQVFKGVDSKGKIQTVNARAVCRNSRFSIAGCPCDSHQTLVASMEVITVK